MKERDKNIEADEKEKIEINEKLIFQGNEIIQLGYLHDKYTEVKNINGEDQKEIFLKNHDEYTEGGNSKERYYQQ